MVSTARVIPIPHFILKGSLVDPRLRASNKHVPIVRVPRAGGRLGCHSHPSEAARCASTEDHQAPSPSLFREPRNQYSFNVSRFTFNFLRRIRRHEHEYFEALVCVILHAMLFPGRRHGPLPRTEHLFL